MGVAKLNVLIFIQCPEEIHDRCVFFYDLSTNAIQHSVAFESQGKMTSVIAEKSGTACIKQMQDHVMKSRLAYTNGILLRCRVSEIP